MDGDRLPTVRDLLHARSVAVIGASEDQTKFGGRLLRMMLKHRYAGRTYPVSASRPTLYGLRAYRDVADLPETPDLAVIAIPPAATPAAVRACADRGVKGAVVITAQFSDAGPEGAAAEREMVAVARGRGMRLWGPNCLGVISPARGLVLCSSPALDVDRLIGSPIGFVTQSGALLGTLFDKAHARGFGFSHAMSVGNQSDLEICDFVDFLIEDADTEVICTYVEGLKDPDRFRRVAASARRAGKPWLMLKAGRTAAGAAAAFSHTASLAGDYRAFEAVCRESGVWLVDDQDALQLLAACLVRYPKRTIGRLAVLSPSGGSASVTTDRLSDAGIALADLGRATLDELRTALKVAHVGNPVDYGGNAAPTVRRAMEIVCRDPGVDAALCVITTAPALDQACAALTEAAAPSGLPLLFVMQPGAAADAARAELVRRRVPFADSLDEAVRALRCWIANAAAPPGQALDARRPAGISEVSIARDREVLDEAGTKAILERYGIAVNAGVVVADADEAARSSASMAFPVVVKVVSPDISHKSDVGGVALNLDTPRAVGDAVLRMGERVRAAAPGAAIQGYLVQEMIPDGTEFLVGLTRDEQFGPMVVVGAGGVLVELLDDTAVAPAPVSVDRARAMIESLRAGRLLRGIRGREPLDADALAEVVSRVSWLGSDHRASIAELDINPVLVRARGMGCIAVDARARLAPASPVPTP